MSENAKVPSLYEDYEDDSDKQKNGVWFDLDDVRRVKVASWMNDNHRAAVQAAYAPYKSITQSGREVPEKTATKLNIRAMADTVLLDWDGPGWLDRNRQPMPYSVENAVQVLTDLKRVRDTVTVFAGTVERFRKEVVAAAVGESSSASGGTESGETQPTSSTAS